MDDIIKNIKSEFNFQIENIPKNEIQNLINLIACNSNSNIYFTGIGKSQNIAFHCCELLKSIGLKTFNLDSIKTLHGDKGTIKKEDIVFFMSNSGNTKELLPVN